MLIPYLGLNFHLRPIPPAVPYPTYDEITWKLGEPRHNIASTPPKISLLFFLLFLPTPGAFTLLLATIFRLTSKLLVKMSFETKATITDFGGKLLKLSHKAQTTNCEMNLNLFVPGSASSSKPAPVLFYLAGLTCTGDNGAEKGFFQARASEKGIAVVYPDTSPRGLEIAGEDESYDFGSGAGFYVDATQDPWTKGYNMYSYITDELPKALFNHFKELDGNRVSITGHSMGGHGALTLFLKNPGMYKSVSAFAPICNPKNCPWGDKAFSGYFGKDNKSKWDEHDATELLPKYPHDTDILIDVGTGDNFYKQEQLLPENFEKAAKSAGKSVKVNYREGYDHSYFFISTFASDHVDHAAKYLVK